MCADHLILGQPYDNHTDEKRYRIEACTESLLIGHASRVDDLPCITNPSLAAHEFVTGVSDIATGGSVLEIARYQPRYRI